MAVCQLKMYWLIYCYRGQAPFHILTAFILRNCQLQR